jgi:signal transduction histidine kinase
MRWRMLIVLTLLGAVTVAAFAVPLGVSLAESRTREFLLTRDTDLQRFTALANSYVTNGTPGALFDELRAYRDLYGEPIAVVSTRGAPAFAVDLDTNDPEVAGAVSRALRNQQDPPLDFLTPWSTDQVVLAKTAGTDANINGAVVVSASTAAARADITRSWLFILLGVLAALTALVAFAMAVSGWVLRPLGRLSLEIEQLSAGLPFRPTSSGDQHDARVTPDKGPPELRSLSRTFQRMARAVRGSNQAQRRLVADTAHQLRNPLAALQLRLDALDGLVAPAAEAGYQRAVGESVRLAEILDDLLALSSAEAAARTERSEPPWCLPLAVITDRVQFWQHTADLHHTVLQITDDGSEPAAAIGSSELGQILDVLLDNACKYAGTGTTVTADVRTSTLTEAAASLHEGLVTRTWVVITIADNGRGVPADELQRLTDRFYRGTSANASDGSARPGTGLGLAIVDALVTAAGAELVVSQTPGGGLTFTITVAAAENTSPEMAGADDNPVVESSAAPSEVRQ